jgi:hypothetical protein
LTLRNAGESHEKEAGGEEDPGGGFGSFGDGEAGRGPARGSDFDEEDLEAAGEEGGVAEAAEPGAGEDGVEGGGGGDGMERTGDEDAEEGVVGGIAGEEEDVFKGPGCGEGVEAGPVAGVRRVGEGMELEEKGCGRREGQESPEERGAGDEAPCETVKMGHGNTSTESVPLGRRGSQGEAKNEKSK